MTSLTKVVLSGQQEFLADKVELFQTTNHKGRLVKRPVANVSDYNSSTNSKDLLINLLLQFLAVTAGGGGGGGGDGGGGSAVVVVAVVLRIDRRRDRSRSIVVCCIEWRLVP